MTELGKRSQNKKITVNDSINVSIADDNEALNVSHYKKLDDEKDDRKAEDTNTDDKEKIKTGNDAKVRSFKDVFRYLLKVEVSNGILADGCFMRS